MWRSGAAEQRLWVGPGRYRGGCRHAVTNRDAESYANSNSYTFCMQRGDGDANTYGHYDSNGNTYSHSDCHSNSYGNGYTDCKPDAVAYTDVDTEDYSNTEASAHAAASPLAGKVTSGW